MSFSPSYPEKPQTITRKWGVYDPEDYHQFGFDYHNGDDCVIPNDKLVHAPFPGTIVRWFNEPNGGGIGCGLLSDATYTWDAWSEMGSDGKIFNFPSGEAKVLVDFLHCEKNLIPEGLRVNEGDAIAVPDNTGFTTGPHTHRQWRRETLVPITKGVQVNPSYRILGDNYLQDFDMNDANNSFNPQKFWSGVYASTIDTVKIIVSQAEIISNEIEAAAINKNQKLSFWIMVQNAILKVVDFLQQK